MGETAATTPHGVWIALYARLVSAPSPLGRFWPALPAVLIGLLGFVWPVACLCQRGLSGGTAGHSPILQLLRPGPYRRALLDSLGLSLLVAMASVLFCLPAALALARARCAGRGLLRAAFAVPLSLSGVVIGFLAVAMLGNVGVVPTFFHAPRLFGSAYGLSGLVIAYLYFEVPRATLTLEAALGTIDDGLLDAARTLGARPVQVLFRVFLPLCAPALRAALGVTFAASLGSYGVALILAARFPLLPVELYRAFTGTLDDALAAAMAALLLLCSASILLLLSRPLRAEGPR